jgi:hypothetical protein
MTILNIRTFLEDAINAKAARELGTVEGTRDEKWLRVCEDNFF